MVLESVTLAWNFSSSLVNASLSSAHCFSGSLTVLGAFLTASLERSFASLESLTSSSARAGEVLLGLLVSDRGAGGLLDGVALGVDLFHQLVERSPFVVGN